MGRKVLMTVGFILLVCFLIAGFSGVVFADDGAYRSILKIGGLLAAILGIVGIAVAGYFSGKDYDSYTGWERYTHGVGMFFNRTPFRKDKPTYEMTNKTRRVKWEESILNRLQTMMLLMMPPDGSEPKWLPDKGPEALPEPVRTFFLDNKDRYNLTLETFGLIQKQHVEWPKYADRYAIIDAWANSLGSSFESWDGSFILDRLYPPEPVGLPDEWDFRGIHRDKPLPFKSPTHASQLLKKITHTFGATLVGITKLNPDWCYQGSLRGVGEGDYEVPPHWEYAIVFAVPHEWDMFYVNPSYGTSYDAYSYLRVIAARLEVFIHELGYPARSHVPPFLYDIMMPPVAVDAGLGEQGRMGLLLTPELGCNARLACVTTNIPMTVDKPIDFGVREFCRKCKICAEKCPTGAISHSDEPDLVYGYKRWKIRDDLCFKTWASVAASKVSHGCRICLAVCPYSRKNNWLHTLSRQIEPRDPIGLVSIMLLWMQKTFFRYPEARDFLPPPEGKNATYHEPPDWLQTEKWFDVNRTW
jgi:epoxyqueuosine reductase